MVWKKSSLISILSLFVILSACSGTSTSEKIYNHLEKAVENEQAFGNQQNEIVELEQKEQEIYNQIIDLSMEEFDKIKELSNQALENIEARKEKLEKEKESIEASKEEFMNIEDMISDLEEEAAKKKGKELFSTMTDRYKAYDQLYKAYADSLSLEEDLYTMLQEKDLEQETLTEHIEKLNESYQKVIDANETFNELTTEYNALKKEFYEAAGVEVNYEENSKSDTNNNKDSGKSDAKESDE